MRILLFKRTTAYGLFLKILQRPSAYYFFLQPSGTLLGAWNYWDARRAILYCLLAGDNISVFTHPPALDRLQGSLRLFVCACAVIMRWVCYESAMRFIGAPRELCSNGERRRCGALLSLPGKRLSLAKPSPTIRASSDCGAKIRRTFWVLQIFFEKNEKKWKKII